MVKKTLNNWMLECGVIAMSFLFASLAMADGVVVIPLSSKVGSSSWVDGIGKVTTSVNVGIGSATPNAKLDVNGAIKIADDNLTCDVSKAGLIRWTGSSFEGCDGKTWQLLSPVPTVYSSGHEWMDRNLGATRVAESFDDLQAYGNLYQWGRFSDGHESRTSLTTTTQSPGDTPVDGKFIYGSDDWRSTPNDNLWQDSGINNPCPPGFRLPTKVEWEAEMLSWSSHDAAGAYASPLKLTLAGDRWSNDGSVNDEGEFGYYITSTLDGNTPSVPYRLLIFQGGASVGTGSSYRAKGCSIRCIKN